MALRIHLMLLRKSPSLELFRRASHTGKMDLERLRILKRCSQDIHLASTSLYPKAKDIPLPTNIEDINAIETGRFSPQRARDITGDVILTQNSSGESIGKEDFPADNFVQSYDCSGTVSLNSAMQTNVPDPYTAKGKASSHLNMPGGEWGRSDKYVAQDLQNSHYTNVKENDLGKPAATALHGNKGTYVNWKALWTVGPNLQLRHFSSASTSPNSESNSKKVDKVSELKKAFKDYGATVIVFHVGISLMSLGGFYLAVTRGVASPLVCPLHGIRAALLSCSLIFFLYAEVLLLLCSSGIDMTGIFPADLSSEVAGEVGAFVIAYAIHKMFAPVRISITLFSAPFIVRYLRKIGILARP